MAPSSDGAGLHPARQSDTHSYLKPGRLASPNVDLWAGVAIIGAVPYLIAVAVLVVGAVAVLWRRSHLQRSQVEERRFRSILEAALDAVVSMDASGNITGWNRQAEAIFGWPRHEALGRRLADTIIPPQFRDAHTRGLERYLSTGEGTVLNRRVEVTATHRSGGAFPVELTVVPILRDGIQHFSAFIRDITERKRAEAELMRRQAHLDGLFHGAPEAIVLIDGENRVERINGEFTRLFGHTTEESVGRNLDHLITPLDLREEAEGFRFRVVSGHPVSADTVRRHKDGRQVQVSVLCFPVRVGADQVAAYGIYRDISARRALEDRLLQSHKMESIGRLAGGVAHDFNNIVTAILGHLDSARVELGQGHPANAELAEVETSARRAAELTRQLLGFARRQIVEPRVVDLNTLTRSTQSLLTRLLGADVRLVLDLDQRLGPVRMDPSQFEQVLVNLAVNARDAMPEGGELNVSTRNLRCAPPEHSVEPDAGPQPWVEIVVRDTGVGMDDATRQRVFEPFFTTKALGAGTGLGLATCHGIIEQSGGRCTVESSPGRGTAFRIFLPQADTPAESVAAPAAPQAATGGGETILLVEDEDSLRGIFQRVLRGKGYSVLAAGSGDEALQQVRAFPGGIDLLVTDVVLPGKNGLEVARAVSAIRPGLKVLFMSGYTEDAIVRRGVQEHDIHFLAKPFGAQQLLRRVREVLDSES
jgi:two-component system, cell cycle sensor histidine kinase and response regulator CckA